MRIDWRGLQRDENEPDIIASLEKRGVWVTKMDRPCDLLCCQHGRWWLCEVKMPKGRLTEAQKRFINTAHCFRADVFILTCDDDITLMMEVMFGGNKNG